MAELLFCEKCRKTMADTNFYTYKNGQKCELWQEEKINSARVNKRPIRFKNINLLSM